MNEIPAQAIVAIATITAALITGVIAIVNLTLSKEQKVSEMRQAWIDGLRDDLAKFFAGARFVVVAVQDKHTAEQSGRAMTHAPSSDHVADQIAVIHETLYRIKLRLNREEENHIELERLLDAIVKTYNEASETYTISNPVIKSISIATDQARIVLKFEWERVKRGEEAFNKLRNWLLPCILIITAIFVAFIFWSKFKSG